MKRRPRRVVVVLLLMLLVAGAIVNVLTAWACAQSPLDGPLQSYAVNERDLAKWNSHRLPGWPATPQSHFGDSNAGRAYEGWGAQEDFGDQGTGNGWLNAILKEFRAGWPMQSMKRNFWLAMGRSLPADSSYKPGQKEQGVWRITKSNETYELPIQPIWPGFAINTLFYAGMLWVLVAVPLVLRRWRRSKRGLCAKCGYDLRGIPPTSDACPECGQGLRSKMG